MKLIDKLITEEKDLVQPTGGLQIEDISKDAHILGSVGITMQLEQINPSGIWWDMEIEQELQRVKDGDTCFCVNFSTNNSREFVYKKRYGEEVNFSDLYSARVTHTTRGRGNTFEQVFELTRKNFCAWEDEMPLLPTMTLDEIYATKISDGLRKRVEARGKGYELRYQFLGSQQDAYAYQEALKISPVTVAVEGRYVWKDGVIVNAGGGYNHAVLYLGMKDGKKIVFDSESLQVLPFAGDYKFQSPAVHSIKKLSMVQTYKKHGDPTICVKKEDEDALIAFASSEDIEGGTLFKSLFNCEYKDTPRIYVEEWPYPVSYWIYAKKVESEQGQELEVPKGMTFWQKLIYLFTK